MEYVALSAHKFESYKNKSYTPSDKLEMLTVESPVFHK